MKVAFILALTFTEFLCLPDFNQWICLDNTLDLVFWKVIDHEIQSSLILVFFAICGFCHKDWKDIYGDAGRS